MTGWVVRAFYQLSNRDSEPRAGQEVAPTVTSRGYRQDHLASSSGNLIPTAEPQLWHRIAPTGEMPATSVRRRIVRGHEKVPTGGQVAVPAGGHDQSPVVAK